MSLFGDGHASDQTGGPERAKAELLDDANEAFASLRADAAAWAEELEERRAWESMDADTWDAESG